MLYSYNWIGEFVADLPEPDNLADLLTMAGLEVDSVKDLSAGIIDVVTARILKIEKHPNADKLALCRVTDGKKTFAIVCGARNMKEGDCVALALPGAVLPGGLKIEKTTIRGVDSEGMLCSASELGLEKKSEGILVLPPDTPSGIDVVDALDLRDFVIEISVTPNRADVLSMWGLAREIAALTGSPLKSPPVDVDEKGPSIDESIGVVIEEGTPCRRYAARVVKGIKVDQSPERIKRRLARCGLRPVNNVVDVTNYLLLERGQPLHAFDLKRISGKKIIVRSAREGESIKTIDGKVRDLAAGITVIADEEGPLAVGGVMGGASSEVSLETTDILLESAWFEPASVRRASRALGLSTDSSYRFERGVDIEAVTDVLDRAASLVLQTCGGKVASGRIDIYPVRFSPPVIDFRIKRAGHLLGLPLETKKVASIFTALGIGVEEKEILLECRPPSWRMDIKEEADLLEEAARVTGYDKIPATFPASHLTGAALPEAYRTRQNVKEALRAGGFMEAMNYSFVSEKESPGGVTLKNPLSSDTAVLRKSLLPSLLSNLRRNLAVKNEEVRLFEVAPVFIPTDGLPLERWKAAALIYGHRWPEAWNFPGEETDFYDIKGATEKLFSFLGLDFPFELAPVKGDYIDLFHPGRSASLAGDLGVLGEAHPDLLAACDIRHPAFLLELDLQRLAEMTGAQKRYRGLPRFPASERDIAFIVDREVTYGEIIRAIMEMDVKLIEKVNLFDVYYGPGVPAGKKSLAMRIVYRSPEKTLVHEEVEEIHSRVAALLISRFAAEIRGASKKV